MPQILLTISVLCAKYNIFIKYFESDVITPQFLLNLYNKLNLIWRELTVPIYMFL